MICPVGKIGRAKLPMQVKEIVKREMSFYLYSNTASSRPVYVTYLTNAP